MNKSVVRRAAQYAESLRRVQREYDAECESYRREGFRAHYCIHGTDRWVDWDNICGPCEDGYGRYEGAVLYELALESARRDSDLMMTRLAKVVGGISDRDMPQDLRMALVDWVQEPMTREVR